MNRPITSMESDTVIKHLPTNKSPGLDVSRVKFYQTFWQELTPILLKLFKKGKKKKKKLSQRRTLPGSFYKITISMIKKTRQRYYCKRNLEVNVTDEYRQKFLKKILAKWTNNTLRASHTYGEVGFIPGMQKWILQYMHINQCDTQY